MGKHFPSWGAWVAAVAAVEPISAGAKASSILQPRLSLLPGIVQSRPGAA